MVIKLFADQSDLDSPKVGSPMPSSCEPEEEPEESKLDDESLLGAGTLWSVRKQCGTCFLCHIVCLLPFLPGESILEAKIEDRVYNVFAFCMGTRLDRGSEEHTYGMMGHGVCNRGRKGHRRVTKSPCYRCPQGGRKKLAQTKKKVPGTLILR